MPSAKATEMAAGSPSGTMETASASAKRKLLYHERPLLLPIAITIMPIASARKATFLPRRAIFFLERCRVVGDRIGDVGEFPELCLVADRDYDGASLSGRDGFSGENDIFGIGE